MLLSKDRILWFDKQTEGNLTFLRERAEHLDKDWIQTQRCCSIQTAPEGWQKDLVCWTELIGEEVEGLAWQLIPPL